MKLLCIICMALYFHAKQYFIRIQRVVKHINLYFMLDTLTLKTRSVWYRWRGTIVFRLNRHVLIVFIVCVKCDTYVLLFFSEFPL